MAAKKRPTKAQISKELERAAREYDELAHAIHQKMLQNVARHLGVSIVEIEEEWAALT